MNITHDELLKRLETLNVRKAIVDSRIYAIFADENLPSVSS